MDTLTITLGIIVVATLVGLAWIDGYKLGQSNGIAAAAAPRRPTVTELINELQPRRPKAAKNRRKAQRKAVRE